MKLLGKGEKPMSDPWIGFGLRGSTCHVRASGVEESHPRLHARLGGLDDDAGQPLTLIDSRLGEIGRHPSKGPYPLTGVFALPYLG